MKSQKFILVVLLVITSMAFLTVGFVLVQTTLEP